MMPYLAQYEQPVTVHNKTMASGVTRRQAALTCSLLRFARLLGVVIRPLPRRSYCAASFRSATRRALVRVCRRQWRIGWNRTGQIALRLQTISLSLPAALRKVASILDCFRDLRSAVHIHAGVGRCRTEVRRGSPQDRLACLRRHHLAGSRFPCRDLGLVAKFFHQIRRAKGGRKACKNQAYSCRESCSCHQSVRSP